MSDHPEQVVHFSEDFYEVSGFYFSRNGSNDSSSHVRDVREIVDKNGVSHRPSFSSESEELCPGVEIHEKGDGRMLKIARTACPVRVWWSERYEYYSYDGDRSDGWSKTEWVRYEAAEATT